MILVAGATGTLGGIITRRLLESGQPVRIMVRPQSDYQALVKAGAQPVIGDLKDPTSLEAACQGVDTVITTANSALRGGDDNPQTVEMQGNRSLIDAAKAAGTVKQFIFISASGAAPDSPIPFLAGKGQAEQHLMASGIPYTIIAPGPFLEVWIGMVVLAPLAQGMPVTVVGTDARKHSFISIRDVSSFVIAALENPQAMNQRLVIGGPQAVSFEDAAGVVARLMGCEAKIVSVHPGEPIPSLPESVQGMMIGFSMGDWVYPMEEMARKFNVRMTPLDEAARAMLTPA